MNLAFSSIPEKKIPDVIRDCYWPLLDLAEDFGGVGIEATGFTLEKIESIDQKWIQKLKKLIKNGTCEFIGSGYSQLIGPLVPASVNRKNLSLGHEIYERLLGMKPGTAYVNEQTYARGLVELYLEAGYRAIIAEWNNAYRFKPDWERGTQYYPQYAVDQKGSKIALIWNNTTCFQKFQSYIHDALDLKEYLSYLKSHASKTGRFLPLYGSDAEVFDFRPGRYKHEHVLAEKIEWDRIRALFKTLQKDPAFGFVLPSTVLKLAKGQDAFNDLHLECPEQAIVVKKQQKYNITRWALSGVNDLSINTKCFRIYDTLKKIEADHDFTKRAGAIQKKTGVNFWKELCFLWSSDFRTHIEKKKFEAFYVRLRTLLKATTAITCKKEISREKGDGSRVFPKIKMRNDTRSLTLETKDLTLTLNKERGLAIDSLIIHELSENPIIGALSRGYFSDISLEEDYYSGYTEIKVPGQKEVFDLRKVAIIMSGLGDSALESVRIGADIIVDLGTIHKTITVHKSEARVDIAYDFDFKDLPPSSFRSGFITFNPEAFDQETLYYSTSNGGLHPDTFELRNAGAITADPLSLLVSARSALGNTEGTLEIGDKHKSIVITTDMAQLAALPMLNFVPLEGTFLLQTLFSLAEIDDTSFVLRSKRTPFKQRFSMSISPKKVPIFEIQKRLREDDPQSPKCAEEGQITGTE
ncbi:MAG: glycoside hydrolase family 57 [bacterium]|nr:glycoside hydrolase family 57 [bacterium]